MYDSSTDTSQELLHRLGGSVQTVGDSREEVVESPHVLGLVVTQHLLEFVLELLIVSLDQHFFASTSKLKDNQSAVSRQSDIHQAW